MRIRKAGQILYEDNDFWDEAALVAVGTVTDLIGCFADQDFFSFPVTADGTAEVGMRFPEEPAMPC